MERGSEMCHDCYKKSNYYTDSEIRDVIKETQWELMEPFNRGISTKYIFRCKKCNKIYNKNCQDVMGNISCICRDWNKKEKINKILEKKNRNERIVENFTNTNQNVKCECSKCGNIYISRVACVISHGCKKCHQIRQRTSIIKNSAGVSYKEYKSMCRKVQR